ncbi:hypothetical protein [Cryobacterium sp. TMT2-42-4]|uniref:hypothetical protein n=1 Tax=Cryobacterium sp. TMT2-42-4 TaxID=1259255 RepID=UPI00106A08C0|nr:hypothetical protein [Cryobacterium sp. TMT2-42-4]TFC35082.1 hypothetical protein E3O18_10290 [Cryobacterium sp. TMT2-42-4]
MRRPDAGHSARIEACSPQRGLAAVGRQDGQLVQSFGDTSLAMTPAPSMMPLFPEREFDACSRAADAALLWWVEFSVGEQQALVGQVIDRIGRALGG